MKIIITGGSGFVGTHLADFLLREGHQITALGRTVRPSGIHHRNYQFVSADTTQTGDWQKELKDADGVVNLAGSTIFKRWTTRYKKQIYDSRVLTTRNVAAALPRGQKITTGRLSLFEEIITTTAIVTGTGCAAKCDFFASRQGRSHIAGG